MTRYRLALLAMPLAAAAAARFLAPDGDVSAGANAGRAPGRVPARMP